MKKIQLIAFAVLLFTVVPFLSSCGSDSETTETETTEAELDIEGEEMMQVQTFENVDQQARTNINELVTPYLELKDALVSTSADEANSKAKLLIEKISKFDLQNFSEDQRPFMSERLNEIREHTEKIANAADVEEQRNAFYPLSESIYKTVKAFGANDGQLYVQYCPMAFDNEGAWWLSNNQEIRNPYFGDKMLKCGSVKEKIDVQ